MRISVFVLSLFLTPHPSEATEKSPIVVALIDTGCDIQHPDLRNNIWTNPGESGRDSAGRDKATNGIDDDGNGFVDDVHGWNFVEDNNRLKDSVGHGTHIAGIIGAHGHAGRGIIGVAPRAKIMILKYYDPSGPPEDNLKNSIKALHYAVQMKAQIINYSGGGFGRSPDEEFAVRKIHKARILLVAAAGNERTNIDETGFYPASYGLSNILTVTAYGKDQQLLKTSDFGAKTVDLAAPGQDIDSTLPGGATGKMSGTSQATAFATGAAALMMAQSPQELSPEQIIRKISQSTSFELHFAGKMKSRGKINLPLALQAALNGE